MKTLLFLIVAVGLLTACEKIDHLCVDDSMCKPLNNCPKPCVLVTIPVKAYFSVITESVVPDITHPEYDYKLTMVGEGTISHLGKLTTRMTFWADGGFVGPYGYGTGIFVAADGDELNFVINDGLIVFNHGDNADYYLTTFNDQILITGGSGRFEGASGIIMTNAFVHYPVYSADYWQTDFFSHGTLILVKVEI